MYLREHIDAYFDPPCSLSAFTVETHQEFLELAHSLNENLLDGPIKRDYLGQLRALMVQTVIDISRACHPCIDQERRSPPKQLPEVAALFRESTPLRK